jgi:acyl carrier protein
VKSKTSDQLRYNLEKSPFFKIISKYISHITGYDLIEIGIDDHFQEDLRIDSIKKAEIVFKTLQETNTHIEESLSLAKMRSVGEVVEFLEKMQLAPVYKKKKLAQKDSGKLFIPLIPKYHSSPQSNNVLPYNYKNFLKIILNKDVIKYSNKISQFYYDLEIDFKCIVFEIDPNMSTEVSYFLELTRQLQIILNPLKKNISQLKIILLSSADTIIFQSFTAFFKSISKEFGLMFKSILHDFSTLQDQQIEQIMNYEFHDLFSIDIRYEKSKRQTLTWIPLDAALETEKNSSQKRKKIIIIGGSKGLAFEIFTRIKKRENIELVIWGRSSKDDLAIQVNLNRLKKLFSKVHYLQVNALLENDFTDALLQSKKLLEKIDLVINSAGVEYSRLFIEKTATEIEQEACTKILISEILQRHNTNKEFDILHFSSIVGAFGNDGQSIYAYGNAYQSKLPDCLSILWPGLNQVGMTENLGILHKLKSSGINLLEIKDAAIWFESILNADFWGNHDKAKFSGAIAYMDPKDIFLMEFFIRDLKKLESINGDIISPADLLFQKIYNSRTDNYLIDHVIENTSIVPASIAMAAILSFGHLYYKKFPDLIDFEIKNIMMLVDSNDVTCYSHFALTKEKINNQKFLKTVILMTSQVEHFVGSILCNVDSQKNYPNRLEQEYNLQVDLTTFYSKECIAFGPKFQVFSEILFNDKLLESAVLGIGPTKSIYYTGLDTIDSLISIIESAFQAVTVYALILGKGLVIPLRFSRLEIFELKFKKYFIVPSVIEINKNNDHLPFVANVVIYNEKNEAILNINHIEMSVIRHHNALPFKFNDCSRHI